MMKPSTMLIMATTNTTDLWKWTQTQNRQFTERYANWQFRRMLQFILLAAVQHQWQQSGTACEPQEFLQFVDECGQSRLDYQSLLMKMSLCFPRPFPEGMWDLLGEERPDQRAAEIKPMDSWAVTQKFGPIPVWSVVFIEPLTGADPYQLTPFYGNRSNFPNNSKSREI